MDGKVNLAQADADDEQRSEADMEMCTSPTSSGSVTPALPVGAPDVLPNVNINLQTPLHPNFLPWTTAAGGSVPFNHPAMGQYQYNVPADSGLAEAYYHCLLPTSTAPQKEIIRLRNAVLYPPKSKTPLPVIRERPLGCRTVFVAGLPEKCTEDILRDMMERCGEIQSIRVSKKNFAHVRFVRHESVDGALYFSGYRMKVEDRNEKEYTGRLHVDYAHARDDLHEWESEQRERDTPSTSGHFGETEATALLEKLKDVETFTEASELLLNWLEKGECSKKTSTLFYGMIAAVNAHVRRLLHDRCQYEEELRQFRDKHNQRLQELMTQFRQIEKIFRVSRKQKNWDHFSRAQRKKVEAWLKHAETMRKASEEAMLRDRQEEEMETSDDEDDVDETNVDEDVSQPNKKMKSDSTDAKTEQRQVEELIQENARLKVELDQVRKTMETMRNVDTDQADGKSSSSVNTVTAKESTVPVAQVDLTSSISPAMESRYMALLSCFLNVHPFGASVDYMWAYLQQTMENARVADVENTLERYPHLFTLQTSGVGAMYERKWIFIGFQK